MKKIVAIIMCVAFLLATMSVCAFAKIFYPDSVPTASPVIDGQIGEDEYVWASDVYQGDTTVDGEFNGVNIAPGTTWGANTWVDGAKLEVTDAQFFMSHDDEYVYFAYKGYNFPYQWSINEGAYVKIGYGSINFQFNPGLTAKAQHNVEVKMDPEAGDTEIYPTVTSHKDSTYTIDAVAEGMVTYTGDISNPADVLVQIEIMLLKEDLEAVNEDQPFDKIGFRGYISMSYAEGMFADKTETRDNYAACFLNRMGYYHELNLYPEGYDPTTAPPETEAPATEAPATDAPATDAPAADAPATDAPATDAPDEGGCGASVAAIGVALVAALGTCTAFVSKKR